MIKTIIILEIDENNIFFRYFRYGFSRLSQIKSILYDGKIKIVIFYVVNSCFYHVKTHKTKMFLTNKTILGDEKSFTFTTSLL